MSVSEHIYDDVNTLPLQFLLIIGFPLTIYTTDNVITEEWLNKWAGKPTVVHNNNLKISNSIWNHAKPVLDYQRIRGHVLVLK